MRLFILAAITGLSSAFSADSELLHKIPFEFHDGLIWVKVELAGTKEPLNYLLDSGATVSTIDLQTARACGIPLGDPQSVDGVSGSAVAFRITNFQASAFGARLPRSILAIDLSAISNQCHRHIDGVLGLDFFRDRVLQINFDSGTIGILKSYHRSLANCDILPIKIRNNAICLPVRIGRSQDQWMRLDTGCDSALEWAGAQAKTREAPASRSASSSIQQMRTSVHLGRSYFSSVAVGLHSDKMFPGEDGLLGNSLLSKFSLIIDQRHRRVILENKYGVTARAASSSQRIL
jgi:hypothetical protein